MAIATVSTPVYDANEAALFRGLAPIVADDSTDNQAAILARLNALIGIQGGILKLPPGKIRMNSYLVWPVDTDPSPPHSGVEMIGCGMNATELVINHGGSPATGITSSGIYITGLVNRLRIADLAIRGTADSNSGGPYDLIRISDHSGKGCTFERVRFKWGRHSGVRTTGTTLGGRDYAVLDCHFDEMITPAMTAENDGGAILTHDLAPGWRIIGNYFHKCGNENTSHAVYVNGGKGGVISGNVFDQSDSPDCRLQVIGGASGWTVTGNVFIGVNTGSDRFSYFGGTENNYSSNTFLNARVKIAASGCVFSDNVFQFTGATGVATRAFEIAGASNPSTENVISNNVMSVTNAHTNWRLIHATQKLVRCIISGNVVHNALLIASASGSTITRSDSNVIRGNRVYFSGHTSTTIGLIHNDNSTYFTNCLIADNVLDTGAGTGRALFDRSTNTNTYRDNTIVGNGTTSTDLTNWLQAEGANRHRLFYATAKWDPATIITGTGKTTTVTVTGAVAGDLVSVSHTQAIPTGCVLNGQVTSSNTVTVTIFNMSGSDQNISIGTLAVFVVHKV